MASAPPDDMDARLLSAQHNPGIQGPSSTEYQLHPGEDLSEERQKEYTERRAHIMEQPWFNIGPAPVVALPGTIWDNRVRAPERRILSWACWEWGQ